MSFQPIREQDVEFLYKVYASTRAEEMKLTGWEDRQKEEFLRMQFNLQHTQYLQNYREAFFNIILLNEVPAGRLYVDRRWNEIRIIDLALLPEFRGQGIGKTILNDLIDEADGKQVPLTLHVEHFNPVLNLYERLGFKKKSDTGVYYFMEKEPVERERHP